MAAARSLHLTRPQHRGGLAHSCILQRSVREEAA